MKKNFFILLAGMISAVLFMPATINGQSSKIPFRYMPEENPGNQDSKAASEKSKKTIRLNEVKIRALRDFAWRFGDKPNVIWLKRDFGYEALFKTDEIKFYVLYDNGGNLIYIHRFYYEENLPADIRHQVKSKYYDFNIKFINEFVFDGPVLNMKNPKDIVAYFVGMEDKNSWFTLLLVNGEMEIYEQYQKVKN